jgi:hypothetical protein
LALVIAPSDSRSGDAGLRREALAWLRGRLARFGFHVVIVGGVQDPQADIDRAIERVSPGDTVLVHVSGRLAGRDSVAFGDTGLIHLGSLTESLVVRSPVHVSFVLELTHEEDPDDALLAAEILQTVMQSLRAKPRGYPVLAAVRPLSMAVDRVAFTRLALPVASDHSGPPPTEALVAGMYDSASATAESHAVAQSFTFSRGEASLPPPRARGEIARAHSFIALKPHTEVGEPVTEDAIEESVPASMSMTSSYGPSIHSLIAEATELRDWSRALELRRHRLHELASPRKKSRELVAIARILQAEFGDADGAIEALEMARALDPKPVSVLQALRRGYERLGRWTHALEVMNALAELTESPAERAQLYVACGRIAFERLSDLDHAMAWFEAALAQDPANPDAHAALGSLRAPLEPDASVVASGPAMLAVDSPVASVHPTLGPVVAMPVSMAAVAMPAPIPVVAMPPPMPVVAMPPPMPGVAMAPGAVGAVPFEPDSDARERSADRLFAEGADDDALAELEIIAEKEPERGSLYEKAFAAHRRTGRTDAAFLAALALEELDAADVDQQVLIEQFRTLAPVRVRASLDETTWKALRAPGADDVLTALFAAVENAAIAARVDELREQRKLVALDPADRLSQSSTASIVRSFQWAARVLSVDCPHLYVRDDAAGGIAPIQAREPSTALGPSVLSGPTAKDLAFLAGRHLAYYRPGHQVLLYYPDRDDLTTLLLAAAQVAMPKAATQSGDATVRALRARIARHLEPDDRTALDAAVRALDARGGQAALGAWMCSVELTAGRAGLLLSGDLATATAILRTESREVANVPTKTRRADLIAFCASRAHAAMRRRFAMTAPESTHPPPAPSSSSSVHVDLGP